MSKRRYRTPCFVMEQKKLEKNLMRLRSLEKEAGVKIFHTLKSFNEASLLPSIAEKLSGMSVSSMKEIRMAKEAKSEHLHLYAPAFKKEELPQLLSKVDTVSFNSLNQWNTFHAMPSKSSMGLRINPKLPLPIPDYCNPNLSYSRLGVDYMTFVETYKKNREYFSNLEGLHFHALFQSSVEGLRVLVEHIMEHYQAILPQLKWINFGGGHNFSDAGYDVLTFVDLMNLFHEHCPSIELYFEPGESVTKGCGDFITTVLDIVRVEGQNIAILDTSIETHLLDVAIVNQRLKVKNTQAFSTPYFYELAGNSCLQGDSIGEYFFKTPLNIGDEVVFEDMMAYSMVKMTEFNGMERAGTYWIKKGIRNG
ncbi:hypothetical protein KKC13_07335 [bacterium]|nr:hypothetical protein [bacterium]MBU1958421.1 hypothetical protein [bacterium]